jgi:hypothetical protein
MSQANWPIHGIVGLLDALVKFPLYRPFLRTVGSQQGLLATSLDKMHPTMCNKPIKHPIFCHGIPAFRKVADQC